MFIRQNLHRYHMILAASILVASLILIHVFIHGVASATAPVRVITTTTIVADLAKNVAHDRAEVISLLKPGADPHAYQPVPSDMAALARADLVLLHGAGLDSRIAQLLDKSGVHAPVETVTKGLQPRPGSGHHHGDAHDHADHGHSHEIDPHFWFDPTLVAVYVDNIAEALIQVDPEGADTYRSRAAAYKQELEALDAWIRTRVAHVPHDRRKLVTNHDSLGYFADRYGFESLGSVFANVSSEAQPSAREMAALVRTMRDAKVTTLFSESTLSDRLIHAVAKEVGPEVQVVRLYTGSLSEPGGPASTYLTFMRYNVDQIVNALTR